MTTEKPTECPRCGGPVSSSVEEFYCAELCGWSAPRLPLFDRVREVLQPFADEASAYDEAKPYPDEDAHLGGFSDYTFGDLLRARSLLAELDELAPAFPDLTEPSNDERREDG